MVKVVANQNLCGACGQLHRTRDPERSARLLYPVPLTKPLGTDHSCPVHGLVSPGCCQRPCDPAAFIWVARLGHFQVGAEGEYAGRWAASLAGVFLEVA